MKKRLEDISGPEQNWSVAQLGARMHYAVPRILNDAGRLQMLYTDICSRKGIGRLAGLVPKLLRSNGLARLASRNPTGISSTKITCFDRFGIEYESRRRKSQTETDLIRSFLWSGKKFSKLVLQDLYEAEGLYCFNSAGLELLEHCKTIGVPGVVEQTIAPKLTEKKLLIHEQQQNPDWQPPSAYDSGPFQELADRESEEWNVATTVVCGSEFVKNEVVSCGGPAQKCIVVPYGAQLPNVITQRSDGTPRTLNRPLRVLTVGAVELRKGSHYVLEVAKALKGTADFRMVGSVCVSENRASELSQSLDLAGVVPRSTVHEHFEWADIFFLPSVCEGSATVTYEAFNAGLPVICTPNTGSVVEDGVSGYLVPHGDTEIMSDRIAGLARNRDLLHSLSEGALQRAKHCTVAAYGERLLQCLRTSELWNSHSRPNTSTKMQ